MTIIDSELSQILLDIYITTIGKTTDFELQDWSRISYDKVEI